MIEYNGQYGKAKVMIDKIDSSTVQQIYNMINNEFFVNPVIIMPDCHAGKGSVIGFTMELGDKIIPNIVGVDIGCGILSINIGKRIPGNISMKELDEKIRDRIPFGTEAYRNGIFNAKDDTFWKNLNIKLRGFGKSYNKRMDMCYGIDEIGYDTFLNICEIIEMDPMRAFNSLGTLGGGNHFIELGKSKKEKDFWITVHSGSRQFGLKVANYWQKVAGKGEMAYLEGNNMFSYLYDMVIAQMYASENRHLMVSVILDILGLKGEDVKEYITSIHNYINMNDFIVRKGAISSYTGNKMIIPFNMEDGILICEGKSNSDWNYSAPHGAGRVGSRSWAKKNLSIDDARKNMKRKGIYTSMLPHDEIKSAYKDPKIIEDSIDPTAEILDRIVPILNLKDK